MKARDEKIEAVRSSSSALCDAMARDDGGEAGERELARSAARLLESLALLFTGGGGRELAIVATKLEEASLWFQQWRRRRDVERGRAPGVGE